MQVPNYIPKSFNGIAIIGEAPGKDEELNGRPFVGTSGRFLGGLCSSVGIVLQNCYLGNISQCRPPGNDISAFHWDGPEIEAGLFSLAEELRQLKPNIVLTLGNTALKAAKDPNSLHPLKPGKFSHSVTDWRGSLFMVDNADSPFYGMKCTASYHPAACLRQYEYTPLLRFDLKRVATEAKSPNLLLPARNFEINLTASEIIERLAAIRRDRPTIAIDIEGGINTMSCISVATSPHSAFIVPFTGSNEGSYFASCQEEASVWRALAEVLEDPLVPKVLQNSLYDCFVLLYSYKIVVRGIVDDTMLKHWQSFCELPKSLGFQCSIYTTEPFYKNERKSTDLPTHWTYCCRDSAVTHEINSVLDKTLRSKLAYDHYRFTMSMLRPLLYMEARGIRYDTKGAIVRQHEVQQQAYATNYNLDVECGTSFDFSCPPEVALQKVVSLICKKKQLVLEPNMLAGAVKKDYVLDAPFLASCLSDWPPPTPTERGQFNAILDTGMNIKSPRFKAYLYERAGLPKQYSSKTGELTTDYEALLNLSKKTDSLVPRLAMEISSLRTRAQMLSIHADDDGRIRCGYNVVGTETGRLTCYTSPTGSGYNLQTIPDYDRDLFLADEGNWMFQCDLSGADTWTVAAHMAFLGETTMLDDLMAGLKPAKILALMLRHGATINNLSRDELRERSKEVKKTDWEYFACKVGTHGINYLMGPIRLANQIFLLSEGKIRLTQAEVRNLQGLYLLRYRVTKWHDWTKRQLSARPELTSAAGHTRRFFGRPDEILAEGLAHEPQINTTYATNRATLNLWNDPENRREDGRLWIEPLHSVHDALIGQFPKERTEWAVPKIRSYFNNTLRIANRDIVIPFEGAYGSAWGKLTEGVI